MDSDEPLASGPSTVTQPAAVRGRTIAARIVLANFAFDIIDVSSLPRPGAASLALPGARISNDMLETFVSQGFIDLVRPDEKAGRPLQADGFGNGQVALDKSANGIGVAL